MCLQWKLGEITREHDVSSTRKKQNKTEGKKWLLLMQLCSIPSNFQVLKCAKFVSQLELCTFNCWSYNLGQITKLICYKTYLSKTVAKVRVTIFTVVGSCHIRAFVIVIRLSLDVHFALGISVCK